MRKESPVVRVTAQARRQQSPLTPYATRGHMITGEQSWGRKTPKREGLGLLWELLGFTPSG